MLIRIFSVALLASTSVIAARAAPLTAGAKSQPSGVVLAAGQTQAVSSKNATLSKTASLCEDVIENVLKGNLAKAGQASTKLKAAIPGVRSLLSARDNGSVKASIAALDKAQGAGDGPQMALAAVEVYRVLETNVDAKARKAPLDVAMLDYAGFKISALAEMPQPNWTLISAAVGQSKGHWSAIASSVTDPSVKSLLIKIQDGLGEAATQQNLAGLKSNSKALLDAVDVLEAHFEKTKGRKTASR